MISRDFPARDFFKQTSKMTGDCRVFKFLRHSVNGKFLMRFQSETSVSKLFRRSEDGSTEKVVRHPMFRNWPKDRASVTFKII